MIRPPALGLRYHARNRSAPGYNRAEGPAARNLGDWHDPPPDFSHLGGANAVVRVCVGRQDVLCRCAMPGGHSPERAARISRREARMNPVKVWKSRPVFVSSTFQDMQAERDHLFQRVFPAVEEWLAGKRRHLEWIDLRMG